MGDKIFTKILAVAAIVGGLMLSAQLPVKRVDGNGSEIMSGPAGTRVLYTMATVPNSDTALTTSTIKVTTLFCNNITASSATLLVQNNVASPKTYYPTITIAANQAVSLVDGNGLTFTSGLRWTAGTINAIQCQVEGVQ